MPGGHEQDSDIKGASDDDNNDADVKDDVFAAAPLDDDDEEEDGATFEEALQKPRRIHLGQYRIPKSSHT
jgi:hypothetical protein